MVEASKSKIEVDSVFYCEEPSIYGRITISNEENILQFFDANKDFQIDYRSELVVRLENGQFASCFNNYPIRKNLSSRPHINNFTSFFIGSNDVFIGNHELDSDAKIRNISYYYGKYSQCFYHQEKVSSIGMEGPKEDFDNIIFEVDTVKYRVTCGISMTYNLGGLKGPVIKPTINISFSDTGSIESIQEIDFIISSFLSFSFGEKVNSSETSISIASERTNVGFSVHSPRPITNLLREARERSSSSYIFRCWADDDSEQTSRSLKIWIERSGRWIESYDLMVQAFELHHTITSERLLVLCRWFESLDASFSEIRKNDEKVEKVILAATSEAKRIGLSSYDQRIRGALSNLGKENRRQQFERLIQVIDDSYGKRLSSRFIIDDFLNAYKFRGKIAHGAGNSIVSDKGDDFSDGIYALEALCFLLTAKDLDMNFDPGHLFYEHPSLTYFHLIPKSKRNR